MATPIPAVLRILVMIAATASTVAVQPVCAQTIIEEWNSVKAPPAPSLQAVTIDKGTTALLMLDFNEQTCNMQRRPRCIASIPKVKTLLTAARTAGLPVVYSLGGGGKPPDIAKDLTPLPNEPVVSSSVDKFQGTDLEKILKDKGIKSVIVVGVAAHGAVLYTASGAALRGMKVIVPVDGISADTLYSEQYVVWHLVNVPVIDPAFTLTTIDQIRF